MGKPNKPRKPQTPLDQLPIQARLKIKNYSPDVCDAAIKGQEIPVALGYELTRFSVIRGIRHHHGFAQELHGVTPEFTRALNARDIMSGIIPTISHPDETPYCIWYPDIPTEHTLRALVQRYPDMIYHAARACAIAGYIDLYKELDPVPEVHVAEEASHAGIQRSNKGSQEIARRIISQPVKFAIMNDYTRTVDIANPRIAFLNADTAVHSSLAARRKHLEPRVLANFYRSSGNPYYPSSYFNITEDWGIDDHNKGEPEPAESYFPLLYEPLPMDLPPINKDKLILMAAHSGDIDRYSRLSRPQMISGEFYCIVWAIYHHPFWAKWWSMQVPKQTSSRFSKFEETMIQRAINARRTMSDDVTWVTPDTPKDLLPRNIWFPRLACPESYERLARIRPDMLWPCLYACIVADYSDLWDKLLLLPSSATLAIGEMMPPVSEGSEAQNLKLQQLSKVVDKILWQEAKTSRNDHYQCDIKAAIPDQLESLEPRPGDAPALMFQHSSRELYTPTSDRSSRFVYRNDPVFVSVFDWGRCSPEYEVYDGVAVEIPSIDFAVFARDAVGVDHDVWKEKGNADLQMYEVYELLEKEHLVTSV
ncbi:hypothetical protein P168DRAFT_292893 [Aspergillus campestris IBT 28561]|uniref:Uncharacterized protein n=1 Tax=Aspergillus campestris (strain IBT 28561) TaxID=1392248 RepID=A0A2I1CTL1_ASPC2|nr:uncharacterized protein P168DRAFT_292893 [Aspergillus campestris IBT 28561]PKY00970.1 hypothetical protein P168DRAFT_292893 [Aspergillus campestris IBT 28561]